MANLPHKIPGKALFVYSMCLLSLIPTTKADPTFRSKDCNSNAPNDLAVCPSNQTNPDVCRDCIDYASRDAVVRCPGSKLVSIVYDECTVRYSNVSAPTIKGADPTFLYTECPNATLSTTSTYATNSTYHTNLKTLLSGLSSNSNSSIGFYNFTAGSSSPDVAYGLFICRGDVSAAVCRDCVAYAAGDVVKQCPRSKQVTIWYDECILRYSNVSSFSTLDTSFRLILRNPQNVTNSTSFRDALGEMS
ncbi:hypothetical protein RHGRI_037337 [Rhododendron griersonianum]|uniref:Gnk2-homologous domain-containing protein n=1 Tax=Rhododendron griersonianum TaxID=479676 RepID=A0AAV6HS07_9ERIC|nr:hypothetical protein RHGRI_037337 [Rhododendron griersonianum]